MDRLDSLDFGCSEDANFVKDFRKSHLGELVRMQECGTVCEDVMPDLRQVPMLIKDYSPGGTPSRH